MADTKTGHHVVVKQTDNNTAVTITTVIDGKALAWVRCDAKQLDELIRILQKNRKELRA